MEIRFVWVWSEWPVVCGGFDRRSLADRPFRLLMLRAFSPLSPKTSAKYVFFEMSVNAPMFRGRGGKNAQHQNLRFGLLLRGQTEAYQSVEKGV
jgi:hypothetical protein